MASEIPAREPAHLEVPTTRGARWAGSWNRWLWPALPVVAALVALRSMFVPGNIFYLRDLSIEYWPMHLWYRRTVWSGQSPLWDPYLGFGQSAIADPVRQICAPLSIPFRLLLPETLGFNLWVALPFPLAALGAYLFLRITVTRQAAALGAVVFALAGPVLSTGNFINMSWAVCLIPWVLLGVDRLVTQPTAVRFSLLAVALALQAVAGEPVTLVGTGVLAVAYAIFGSTGAFTSLRERLRAAAMVVASGAVGFLLAAIQMFPLVDAQRRSLRSVGFDERLRNLWPLHPLTLVESMAPSFFGDYVESGFGASPWIGPLNSGLEPCIFSIYVGIGVLAIALVGGLSFRDRPRSRFWICVFVVSLICALGSYTPVYPALRTLIPPLDSFRFPAKYTVFPAVALSVLCAAGWDSLSSLARGEGSRRTRILAVGLVGVVAASSMGLLLFTLLASGTADHLFTSFAAAAGVEDPTRGASFLAYSITTSAPRVLGLAVVVVFLIWIGSSGHPAAGRARGALYVLIVLDLAVTNGGINPTMPASLLDAPDWAALTRAHPESRIYVGKRPGQAVAGPRDIDDPEPERGLPVSDLTITQVEATQRVLFANFASGWALREAVSHDNNALWPREYISALVRFRLSEREERWRFLSRTGVRYYLTAVPPPGAPRELARLPDQEEIRLYDGGPPTPRAFLAEGALEFQDRASNVGRLFSPDFEPERYVLLEGAAGPRFGDSGESVRAQARILKDETTQVVLEADVPENGGFLVLHDSFDPYWTVTVDGGEGQVLRANGLFRAVYLSPGRHEVEFCYNPLPFEAGAGVTTATSIVLLLVCLWRGRRVHRRVQRPNGRTAGSSP